MPNGSRPVWTVGRKLLGNILPMVLALPLLALGILGFPSTGMSGSTLGYFVSFPIVGWLATNFLGPSGSWGMKQVMGKRLHDERPFDKTWKILVGFARPAYRGLLDPHEDIGYLLVHSNRLEFFGSTHNIEIDRSEVQKVGFRPNPHTWLGLGRWVCVEGVSQGQSVRLLVEPRERGTLIGNLIEGTKLKQRIQNWKAGVAPPASNS